MKVLEFWNLVKSLSLWMKTQKCQHMAVFLCVGTQLLSRQSNWCQNILPPISTRRKPEKTVDSRSEKGLGQEFLWSNSNKVCSRHFKAEDFKTTPTHVVSLKPGVVPSIFAWKRSSPRQRSPPTPRLTNRIEILIEKLREESLETVRTSIEIPSAISSSSSTTTTIDLEPPVTEPDSYFTERQSVKDTKIYELEDKIAALLSKNKKLEEEVSLLEERCCDLN